VTCVKDPLSGHVGGPTVNTEFKVVDVAEMGYTSKDKDTQGRDMPRGEVWIRGPGVFVGYYKDEEKT
jgi:long-chain acyl-CoA synthetase